MHTDTTVAIAYHSGYGHTAVLAEAVADAVADAGATAVPVPVEGITPEQWEALDTADAIVFGAPTYLGTASGAFHAFAESTSRRWAERVWTDKVAAGFTISGSMSGDKLHTLQYFSVFAAQHGMHWVSLDLLPGWSASTASEHDLNRLGITLGAGAQTDTDRGPEEVSKADAQTAFHLGARVARVAGTLRAGLRAGTAFGEEQRI
ncbi:flavodoxin family protein [Streptomyces luteolus]|uniref:Flavodoxin family protein n=1 Tax=Streptomyces luteolus TaxID=3043615 RepID=A0ABT6T4S8_9ACTN|nr:flavodoxin family protein [Streptomyces sp. B-S-A12]MDI3422871.1 flavodoxin family protein [Streptomyces sp. B-S-A12]